jgi:hypothetical protein
MQRHTPFGIVKLGVAQSMFYFSDVLGDNDGLNANSSADFATWRRGSDSAVHSNVGDNRQFDGFAPSSPGCRQTQPPGRVAQNRSFAATLCRFAGSAADSLTDGHFASIVTAVGCAISCMAGATAVDRISF